MLLNCPICPICDKPKKKTSLGKKKKSLRKKDSLIQNGGYKFFQKKSTRLEDCKKSFFGNNCESGLQCVKSNIQQKNICMNKKDIEANNINKLKNVINNYVATQPFRIYKKDLIKYGLGTQDAILKQASKDILRCQGTCSLNVINNNTGSQLIGSHAIEEVKDFLKNSEFDDEKQVEILLFLTQGAFALGYEKLRNKINPNIESYNVRDKPDVYNTQVTIQQDDILYRLTKSVYIVDMKNRPLFSVLFTTIFNINKPKQDVQITYNVYE